MSESMLIRFDDKDVQTLLRNIPPTILVPATIRALNKVAANVKTAANRAIRTRRALPAATVNKAMAIRRAHPGKLQSTLVVTGRPIALKDYKARQIRKGVSVAVSPGPRKLVPGAFVVQKLSGQVFKREGSRRLPIEKLFGPSLPSTFLQEQVKLAWITVAKDSMVKRHAEELRFELHKLERKVAP